MIKHLNLLMDCLSKWKKKLKFSGLFPIFHLSNDVASGSDIMPFDKIDKCYIMTFILMWCKRLQNLDVFTPKM